jgi:hypothetical protein
MPRAPVKSLFIDDDQQEAERLAGRMSEFPGLRCVPMYPPTDELGIRTIVNEAPDILFIDYQLNRPIEGRLPTFRRGSTLAAVIRAALPVIPIILVSRQEVKESGRLNASRDVKGAFDELVLKSEFVQHTDAIHELTLSLVHGFRELDDCRKDWPSLRAVLGAKKSEEDSLFAADPPKGVLLRTSWRVVEVATWIRGILLTYPGVLYDSLHASATLGIAESSFLSAGVQRFFSATMYKGPFVEEGKRWWKSRLLEKGYALLHRQNMTGQPSSDFGEAWRKAKKSPRLRPSVCVYSQEQRAESVCYILHKPVMIKHSLPYWPDNRPHVMDEARVSFRAIRESNEFDERLCPPDGRDLVRLIQRGIDPA